MSNSNPMKSYQRYKGGRPRSTGKKLLTAFLALVLAAALVFAALVGLVIFESRDDLSGAPQMMIVLGCQVMPSGRPSILLRDRLEKALAYLEDNPDAIVVVSGGQGYNEPVSEAFAMAEFLIRSGVQEERILLEERSENTVQNIYYSVELLAENGYDTTDNIIVVSNGFHLSRVKLLWGRMAGHTDNLSMLAAPATHLPSRVKMHIREPLALIKSFLFDWGV